MDSESNPKQRAGYRAAELVEDGMAVGLGTGSTAFYLVERLAARVREESLRVRCIPTSRRTEEQARSLGIPLIDFGEVRELDLAIDGADEIGPGLSLVKGGGGALLREKLVASAARRFVVIADAAKRVEVLGQFPLPVEVVPFAWQVTAGRVARVTGVEPSLRRGEGGGVFITDNGNYILDCRCGRIPDPARTERELKLLTGVVECGLFVGLAHSAVVGTDDGVETISPADL
ncbi:MAG TPA: ribose-5-phosphate isomerase RpiA [Pyrinomonadaceae bacterium]|jgi:ribose 5-phosphate isomerase A|nr:ribose-5-phosphate isomerase RpiA [Pyrinomonadaceae bacterium]